MRVAEKKVDIIVPIYNKSEYMINLLDEFSKYSTSLFNIILVDDGSTDNSVDLIRYYIENNKFDNIYLFTKKNGGVSSARNLGISKSKSKYVWFFDPDDKPYNNVLEIIDLKEELTADVLVFNYIIKNIKKNTVKEFIFDSYCELSGLEFMEQYNYFSEKNNMSYIWNKLYKRDVLQEVFFKEGVNLSEDRRFNLEVFSKKITVKIINKKMYIYHVYGENTLSSVLNEKNIKDIYDTNLINLKFLKFNRKYCKKHILDQIFLRKKSNENLYLFYKQEHHNLNIKILPWLSIKEVIVFILIILNIHKILFKFYVKV